MALPNGIHSTQELLDAQTHVWNHMFSFMNSMSLKCAVQLGIPDIIHKHAKPITLSELIHALPAINKSKSHCIERLMRVLVHSKVFVKVKISNDNKETGYWLTPTSILLVREEPLNMTSFILQNLHSIFTDPSHHLSKWLENDDPTASVTAYGRTMWEQIGGDPEMNRLFNESMASDSCLVTTLLVRDCRRVFEGLKTMVDVGGGTGTVARAIADAFGPGLKCSVLDQPHVVAGLKGTENLTFVAGDMFESIPPADAVFMKWILHDWCDEDCVKILRKCKQAIASNNNAGSGKVILVDIVVREKRDNENENKNEHEAMLLETQLLWDMQMMALLNGKERTEKDWGKLFDDAGYTSYTIAPLLGLRSIIEGFP